MKSKFLSDLHVNIDEACPLWNGEIQMAEKRLLERVREALRVRHYSLATERVYVMWVRRFILFHGKRHPAEMGKREVEAFLTHLAVARGVSPSTQNQALQAILFLYLQVLKQELPWLDSVVRAKPKHRVPVVLSVEEVSQVLARLGHKDVRTTMIYTHVVNRGALGALSPLDRLRPAIPGS